MVEITSYVFLFIVHALPILEGNQQHQQQKL